MFTSSLKQTLRKFATNASTDEDSLEIAVKEERIPEVKTEMEMDMMPYELEVHAVSTDRARNSFASK